MSRTDKDRPYRIKVQDEFYDREERHRHIPRRVLCVTGERTFERTYRLWGKDPEHRVETYTRPTGFYRYYPAVCDIDMPEPRRYRWSSNDCYYALPYHEARYHTAPPRWYVNYAYHAPERVRSRDVLREAAKEWNATGDTDLQPEERQGRHSARWGWW